MHASTLFPVLSLTFAPRDPKSLDKSRGMPLLKASAKPTVEQEDQLAESGFATGSMIKQFPCTEANF
jgi:hypothetical protein